VFGKAKTNQSPILALLLVCPSRAQKKPNSLCELGFSISQRL